MSLLGSHLEVEPNVLLELGIMSHETFCIVLVAADHKETFLCIYYD